ncbi:MAG: hypothetical protein GY870_00470 [archaeon]|nr:hypothetical protein [archaeon]
MDKSVSIFKITIIIVSFCLVLGIIYVSLLGENKKIDDIVDEYFKNIKEYKYIEAYQHLSEDSKNGYFADIGSFSDFSFLIESSLLQKYSLIDSEDYNVKLKRSHLWIPYLKKDEIYVSVLLKKSSPNILSFFKNYKEDIFVENLFVMGRENGAWKITGINIYDSLISRIFKEIEARFDLKNSLIITQNKIIINKLEITTQNISIVEKRMYQYILRKAVDLIEDKAVAVGN